MREGGIDYDFIPEHNLRIAREQHEQLTKHKSRTRHNSCSPVNGEHPKKKVKKKLRVRSVPRIKVDAKLLSEKNSIDTKKPTGESIGPARQPETPKPPDQQKLKIRSEQMWKQIEENTSKKKTQVAVNKKSKKVYGLLKETYDIQLACAECFHDNKYFNFSHTCKEDILLCSLINQYKWVKVRNKPHQYKGSQSLCERIEDGEPCPQGDRCKQPHSETEKHIWEIVEKENWGIGALLDDLKRPTGLRIRHAWEKLYDTIYLKCVCRKCFIKQDFKNFEKSKKKPFCKANHPWNIGHILLVLDLKEDPPKYIDLMKYDKIGYQENTKKYLEYITDMIKNGTSLIEIFDAYISVRNKVKDMNRSKTKPGRLQQRYFYDNIYTDKKDCTDYFDTELDDIYSDENIDRSDIEETYKTDFMNQIDEGQLYYEIRPHEELKQLLLSDNERYKLCSIQLDGSQRATCTTVDKKKEKIEIRGRQNCGPTCTGDIVVVEVKKCNVLDAEWKQKSDDTVDTQTVRGSVVGIFKQNTNRKAYNFVCIVDEYLSHLMIPMCGLLPKIHTFQEPIKKLPEAMRNQRVCVVDSKDDHEYIRTVSLDTTNKRNKIFIVRYEKWTPRNIYPFGYVIKVIEPGNDLITGQQILNIMYQVPRDYDEVTDKKLEQKFDKGIPSSYFENRMDCTDLNVFSIDPPNCKDVDDAISIERYTKTKKGKNVYRVGIHIADVTEFLKKNDSVDEKAAINKTSFYNNGAISSMLPKLLGEELCSLQQNQKRLTLSVFLYMDENGKIRNHDICETFIKNKRQMTYTEAEEILEGQSMPESCSQIETDLRLLWNLISKKRQERHGEKYLYKDLTLLYSNEVETPCAHFLIEELMILANTYTAEYLCFHYPDQTIVRSQVAPNEMDLEKWCQRNASSIKSSSYFWKFRNDIKDYPCHPKVVILESTHKMLQRAMNCENIDDIVNIVNTEKLHPSMTVAHTEWLDLQQRAINHRHKNDDTAQSRHFSLEKNMYTWFTSPIRRYMDVIVHRQIKSFLSDSTIKNSPYSKDELDEFCGEFNSVVLRSRKFDRANKLLKTVSELKIKPIFLAGVIKSIDKDGIEFCFPAIPHMPKINRTVRFGSLLLSDKPDIENNYTELRWKKRIYDHSVNPTNARRFVSKGEYTALCNNNFTTEIELTAWNDLKKVILEGDESEIIGATSRMLHESFSKSGINDVTSEMMPGKKIIQHHCLFNYRFQVGNICQIQLGASDQKGILEPEVKLINMSETLDICVEHMVNPVKCFADAATQECKVTYRDLQEYQDIWLPVLAMESVTNSVCNGDPIIIHNVEITLNQNNGLYFGSFTLPKDFCEHRKIPFISDSKEEKETNMDYFCIRIAYDQATPLVRSSRPDDAANHLTKRNVWTVHALLKNAVLDRKQCIKVDFEVKQHPGERPQEVKLDTKLFATVEYITRLLPDARMYTAVKNIAQASEFCQNIILGKSDINDEVECEIPEDLNIVVSDATYIDGTKLPLPCNNRTQDMAIRNALKKKMCLIQGPPGTGKTLTGVKLVYWFAQLNKKSGLREQVMYCCPSNSAVDVATKQLRHRLGRKCPSIIRVYSDLLEKQVYPIPRDLESGIFNGRKYKLLFKDEQKEYALHHLIRKPSNKYHREILSFDKRFRNSSPEDIGDEEIKKYEKLITDAAVAELNKYEVILCTCTVSACPKMIRGTNIKQLIIDESGMCMEPQTLIPIISLKPQQITLIGDHKQLRPIVLNQTAKDLGLETSMFERQQRIYGTIMLDEQYRMHKEICAFPSKHFYEGKLYTIPTRYWGGPPMTIWPNPQSPTVFCHVEGEEHSLTVSTDDGNEQSKWNEAEVFHSVRIFQDFVYQYGVHPKNITIISQYRAQCKEIERRLNEFGFDKINIGTVVASQGDEWDYVIFSTVRSMPRYEIDKRPSPGWLKRNLGFIVDDHQINVAITRARRGLVIIGNKHLLKSDNDQQSGFWKKLLDFYQYRKCVVDAGHFPITPDALQRNIEKKNFSMDVGEKEMRNLDLSSFREVAPRFRKNILNAQKAVFHQH